MYFFSFLTFLFLFFSIECDLVLAIRNAFFCPPRILYNNFIQKLCLSTHQVILCNMYSWNMYFLQMKTDFPHTPSFKANLLLGLLGVPIHYSRVLLAWKMFLTSLFFRTELDWHRLPWAVYCSLLLFAAGKEGPHLLVPAPVLVVLLCLIWAVSVLFHISCPAHFLSGAWCIRIGVWNSGLVCCLLFQAIFYCNWS